MQLRVEKAREQDVYRDLVRIPQRLRVDHDNQEIRESTI